MKGGRKHIDQVKIGRFIKTLRREKNLTQEQLAEEMNVSRRTVSRWETGRNLPDLDVMISLADFFTVNLRELINGEKEGEKMNQELKETLEMAADYASAEKKKKLENVTMIFIAGYLCLLLGVLIERFTPAALSGFWLLDFLSGVCCGFSFVAFLGSIVYVGRERAKNR